MNDLEATPEKERAKARREEGRPDPEELIRRYGLQDHKGGNSPLPPAASFTSSDISPVSQDSS